ncbi:MULTISPECIES: hypothetical protein [Pandoraea]|uniref:hypothetical protein n=1 Tax=Pandoraea TaxID=93217 RepID=UPI0003D23403|nr:MULTISPECIES: hypothetical protein [Pandoraea]AHB78481.1 hypothetical protein X636_10910 [Pandoraea pnomenusa]
MFDLDKPITMGRVERALEVDAGRRHAEFLRQGVDNPDIRIATAPDDDDPTSILRIARRQQLLGKRKLQSLGLRVFRIRKSLNDHEILAVDDVGQRSLEKVIRVRQILGRRRHRGKRRVVAAVVNSGWHDMAPIARGGQDPRERRVRTARLRVGPTSRCTTTTHALARWRRSTRKVSSPVRQRDFRVSLHGQRESAQHRARERAGARGHGLANANSGLIITRPSR